MSHPPPDDPHGATTPLAAGVPPGRARAAAVLVHGRGGSPEDMLALTAELRVPEVAFLAPRAAGGSWYPHAFLAPLDRNEPHLTSALRALGRAVDGLAESGPGVEHTLLLGFSQGGCLALEFAARAARRYGGLVGLSAGLIGPEGTDRRYPGSLAGTPVFLGCSDSDPHIPLARVRATADVLERLGGRVETRIYPGFPHAVNRDEIEAVRGLLEELARG